MSNSDGFDFDKVLDDAEKETLDQFAGRISKLTKLSVNEVKEICPSQEDKDALDELIGIVNSKTSANEQKIRIVQNVGRFGGILLGIAKKIILPV